MKNYLTKELGYRLLPLSVRERLAQNPEHLQDTSELSE